jgi:hypothetical protein
MVRSLAHIQLMSWGRLPKRRCRQRPALDDPFRPSGPSASRGDTPTSITSPGAKALPAHRDKPGRPRVPPILNPAAIPTR